RTTAPDHHRSVVTMVGRPEVVEAAARLAFERIDLRRRSWPGTSFSRSPHPRTWPRSPARPGSPAAGFTGCALAFDLPQRGAIQISMNLEDQRRTAPMDVVRAIEPTSARVWRAGAGNGSRCCWRRGGDGCG